MLVYDPIRLQIDLKGVQMEYITFYEKINLFLKNKRPRKPSTYVYRLEPTVGKSGFVSHTKHTAKATNMDLLHS